MTKTRCPNFGKNRFGESACLHPDYHNREKLGICEGMTPFCYVRKMNWSVCINSHDYADKIRFKGEPILYLVDGAQTNEKYANKFVAMLNKKGCVIDTEVDKINHGK